MKSAKCRMFLLLTFLFAGAMLCGCRTSSPAPAEFVYVTDLVPGAILEIRYYSTYNFVGSRIDSYQAPVAILTRRAAEALQQAEKALKAQGCAIKIYDAYRPQSAVDHFVRWAKDQSATAMKQSFYPDIDKSRLFELDYIAAKSGHSRGSTVDLTLVDLLTGKELDMGSPFDFFGPISHHGSKLVTPTQSANREILKNAMLSAGFKLYPEEWWHYTLIDEPYPDIYFDFPVDYILPPLQPVEIEGAAAANNRGDHRNSPYFRHRDYDKLTSTETLTILTGFKTFQQTTEVHCGPAAALMVERYFGRTGGDEIAIGNLMHQKDYRTSSKDGERLYTDWATTVDQMERYFKSIGWQTRSSISEGKLPNGATFADVIQFKNWAIANLKAGTPILVEWSDWGGHWQIIIGYDTMGTEWPGDDMLILADPYDISDHRQDGYYVFNAVRFFYMWQDVKYLPKAQSVQPWVIARPGAEK